MKRFFKKEIIIFIIGLTLCCYPIISNYIEHSKQSEMISTYESESESLNSSQIAEMLDKAVAWNKELLLNQKGIYEESNLDYEDIITMGNGVIGSIEIPKIAVDMPIYQGVDDDVLSIGAGHLEDSSLPVGGENTHAVLTGHRGLPSSKLFTRLDEIELKDLFYIKVLNQTLAYKVEKIEVMEPEKVKYEIEEGKDLVTLITCTPYGINTKRLVITGIRVPYQVKEKESIESKLPSFREVAFYTVPVALSGIGIMVFKKRKE